MNIQVTVGNYSPVDINGSAVTDRAVKGVYVLGGIVLPEDFPGITVGRTARVRMCQAVGWVTAGRPSPILRRAVHPETRPSGG